MGRPKPVKRQKARNAEYYDMQRTQDDLYKRSLNNQNFIKLMDIIQCDENIMLAYRNIKRNGGSQTPGTDGKTIENLEKLSPEQLTQYVRSRLKWYKPQSVRRVEIPKGNGKTRPLGIPTIADRLIQQCFLQVLEPICEAKFHDRSYGFRPLRSAQNAMAVSHKSTRHFPACSHNFPKAGEARFQGRSRLFRLLGKLPYLGESRRILMAVSSKTSSKTRFCYAATRRISSAAVQPSIWA